MRTTVFSATPGLLTIQLPRRKLGHSHWLSSKHINPAVPRALRWVPDLRIRAGPQLGFRHDDPTAFRTCTSVQVTAICNLTTLPRAVWTPANRCVKLKNWRSRCASTRDNTDTYGTSASAKPSGPAEDPQGRGLLDRGHLQDRGRLRFIDRCDYSCGDLHYSSQLGFRRVQQALLRR